MTDPVISALQDQLKAMRDRLDQLDRRGVPDVRLTYATRGGQPWAAPTAGAVPGDFHQPAGLTPVQWNIAVYVSGTNNGTNFWTIKLLESVTGTILGTTTTAALAAAAWVRVSNIAFTAPPAGNVALTVLIISTGTPGSLFIVPEVLAR